MSIQALNWALAQDQIDNSGARFVLLILCNYADEQGQCYPSRETIAQKTSTSVRSVQRHINWLADAGYLVWTNDRNEWNRQSPNIYQLKKPSAKLSPSNEKPSAKSVKAECQSVQKPGDNLAQDTSEENHIRNTLPKTASRGSEKAESVHSQGMQTLKNVIGDYPDGAAQGKALKWMLGRGATVEQIEKALRRQYDDYRPKGMRTSFLTLQKTIFQNGNGNGYKHTGCPVCMQNEYKSRMSLKAGEVYDPARNVVTRCECVK